MIQSFRCIGTEDIFNGANTRAARQVCPETLWRVVRRKLAMLDAAYRLDDLRVPAGNRLEALYRDRAGQHSIRINDQYLICFRWNADGAEEVEIVDYH